MSGSPRSAAILARPAAAAEPDLTVAQAGMTCNLFTDTMLRVLVDQNNVSWNQIGKWLRRVETLQVGQSWG